MSAWVSAMATPLKSTSPNAYLIIGVSRTTLVSVSPNLPTRFAIGSTPFGRSERTLDHLLRSLVAAQVPVLGIPEQNRHDDLRLVRRRVADEPRILHVERLARRERARLACNAFALAEALRGAAEFARAF